MRRIAFVLLSLAFGLNAQIPEQVLIVVNKQSGASRIIGEYYARKRNVPAANICEINTKAAEQIDRETYNSAVEAPIAKFLKTHHLQEQILYIVTTMGVPLRILGDGKGPLNTAASVDSELAVLYRRSKGISIPLQGPAVNPFYRQRDTPFTHPQFGLYMVTRLAAYDLGEVKGIIDKALLARNTGKFVIDLRADESSEGNHWLRAASVLLPGDRLVLDETGKILKNIKDVIAYAAWGSNDRDRKDRFLGFQWLPGAIATEYVSTNARTFVKPPDTWNIGTWADKNTWFAGAPQTMTADYIHEGATGASGHVDEPFLGYNPRPDYVLPAYYSGRNLADSFYMSLPGLSWMNVIIGDPLCRLK